MAQKMQRQIAVVGLVRGGCRLRWRSANLRRWSRRWRRSSRPRVAKVFGYVVLGSDWIGIRGITSASGGCTASSASICHAAPKRDYRFLARYWAQLEAI